MLIRLWRMYRSAVVTAEALAWHRGKRGVEMARSATDGPHETYWEKFQATLVAGLTADRYDSIGCSDNSGRHELANDWARRRGQMIR